MVNRISIMLLILLGCKAPREQLILDYNHLSIVNKNNAYLIQKVEVANSAGKELFTLKLNDNAIGLSKVFLFQSSNHYSQKGDINDIKGDSLSKFIFIAIQSNDKKQTIHFELPFNLNAKGQILIEPIKDPFP